MLRIFPGEALFSAMDGTRMKHGYGKDIEQKETEKMILTTNHAKLAN
jgi:hypothetical protein